VIRTLLSVGATFCLLAAGGARELGLRRSSLDLPAPPVSIVSADLNRDGRRDLVVVLAYAEWSSIAEDRIEGAVQVTEVVPALFDRREARLYLAAADGTYRETGPPLPLSTSVFSVEAGPSSFPAIAITEDGLSAFRLMEDETGAGLRLVEVLSEPSVLAGSETMLPDLDVVRDIDGDDLLDLVLPTPDGLAVYRGTPHGFWPQPIRIELPGIFRASDSDVTQRYPLPQVEDVDGDRVQDLVVPQLGDMPQRIFVLRGEGEGRFEEARQIGVGCLGLRNDAGQDPDGEQSKTIASFGDIDGDGRAEVVTRVVIDTGKSGMKQMKEPRHLYEFHRMRANLSIDPEPYQRLETVGHPFSGGFLDGSSHNLRDLDGDGRDDLITVSFDFSVLQAVRVLTTKKMGIGLDFHVYAQGKDGSFRAVEGQRLEEKLRLDLNRLEIGRMAQFAGDFDGDGRIDFVHLGRGKSITIHRGQPGCRYADVPDLVVSLDEEPQDVALVRIRDLDGDARADIAITRPLASVEPLASVPVRLDLLLSGGGS
jgi:hypothetical protein